MVAITQMNNTDAVVVFSNQTKCTCLNPERGARPVKFADEGLQVALLKLHFLKQV